MADRVIQTFVPSSVLGRMTLVSSSVKGTISPRDAARMEEESARRQGVHLRRMYYSGTQFDEVNAVEQRTCAPGDKRKVPEHRRVHSYSTQIQECVDFLANRLGAGFSITADDRQVQDVLDAIIETTDTIYAVNDDGESEVVTDDVLREALIAGDTPAYVGWDAVSEQAYIEFWECETVEIEMSSRTEIGKVIRYDWAWMEDPISGVERQVEERMVYRMAPNPAGFMECVEERWLEQSEEPDHVRWLGVGRIPWVLLKSDSRSLRSVRGESLITDQAMDTADRYNAVEQTGYLIARYNSHSNVAVIGDAASLKVESDGRVSKDVADVLTFPGGTSLQVLTLPTSPDMIEHQRRVLSEALHAVFGVTRTDPESIQGLGQVSGYALEILNQKTEGTFSRVSRNWRKDWIALMNLVLDVTAWQREATAGVVDMETQEFRSWTPEEPLPMLGWMTTQWWEVDPETVFPNRKLSIRMRSGYIVDDVKIRDDFTAGLISREEALRMRGYEDKQIKKVMKEIEAEADRTKPDTPEIGVFGARPLVEAGTRAGSTVAGDTDGPSSGGMDDL